jgi:hypothetical protein
MRLVRGALSTRREVVVRLTERVEATIYDRPGLWMNDAQLEVLRSELRGVARAAIPGDLVYGVFRPDRAPYENRLVVVGRLIDPTGDEPPIIGFNAMPVLKVPVGGKTVHVMHLGLLVIHPRHQRKGYQGLLYGLGGISLFNRMPEGPVWISNVTEVPAVFGAVAEQFGETWPRPGVAEPPDKTYRDIAVGIMTHCRHEFGVGPEANFDANRFVIEGSYTGGSDALKKTFDSAPRHKNPAVNEYCKAQLDYGRGDDFLQIAKLDGTVVGNYFTNRIPAPLRPAAARQMKLWTYPGRPT